MAKSNNEATISIYLGLFFTTMATLMNEILLTRIFSVTMWYHFAFVAISIALFGITLGGVIVYLFPKYFSPLKIKSQLALNALFFTISIPLGFLIQINLPALTNFFPLILLFTYLITAVPFIFSGITVCLTLTKFPQQVSKLYAADLAGAAVGCLALIATLTITDGPTAVFVVALLGALGTLFFAFHNAAKLQTISWLVVLFLGALVLIQTYLVHRQTPLIRIQYAKGEIERLPIYEKWNPYSRIQVSKDPNYENHPFGWGLSSNYQAPAQEYQLKLDIDKAGVTVLPIFNGDFNQVEYLKHDVTNIAHYLRPNAKVLVIGSGGGRDILSALAFNQQQIIGVEINQDINQAAYQIFGDYTGHLDQDPRVTVVSDEARSYIAKQADKYDLIQLSLIDTWAASSAGAYILTENSLYTIEAWEGFLSHLTDRGILSVSRWYFGQDPAELYRLTALARQTLDRLQIQNPWNHLVIISKLNSATTVKQMPNGVGTLLVSKQPFTAADISRLEKLAQEMDFELTVSPKSAINTTFSTITSSPDLTQFYSKHPLNIQAPTDDRPFFFNMIKISKAFDPQLRQQGNNSFNLDAISTLMSLLIIVIALTLIFIVVPLKFTRQNLKIKHVPLFVFFAFIGLAYLLIEVSQMQRLIVFLGHPIYSLSVVLFTLLLSSGFGSFYTQQLNIKTQSAKIKKIFLFLILLLIFTGLTTWPMIHRFQSQPNHVRILISALMLMPIGFFMGMPFPLGMKLAAQKSPTITPWLWGINGAMSVCASVVAVVLAIGLGISVSFWTGVVCYIAAALAFWKAQ